MILFPARPSRKAFAASFALGGALLLAGCGGGQEKPILVPTIKASLFYVTPGLDRTVFFSNTVVVGDIIQMDVVVQDTSGTLDMDDVDLVLRYDATFIQVTNLSGQNTLFGTCNTVNPVCGVNSPICADNRTVANRGGSRFCRSDGTTPCAVDKDCTASGDACGSFGTLEAAFAVLTGPKVCSNNPSISCSSNSSCHFCQIETTAPCAGNADCTGTCGPGNTCSNIPARSCLIDTDCQDTCDLVSICRGCPSVIVSGTRKIASLALRVMKQGAGDIRFVIPSAPGGAGSAVRKDLVDQAVDFFPREGGSAGDISITGTL